MVSSSLDFSGPTPTLKLVAHSHLGLATGIPGGETLKGKTTFIKITGGSITSPQNTDASAPILSLAVQSRGWDYPTLHASDGKLSLAVDFVALSTDGKSEVFKFKNSCFITVDEEVGAIMSGVGTKSTEFGEKDVIETITCQTSSEQWRWMNFATMFGQCRLLAGKEGRLIGIELKSFRSWSVLEFGECF